MGRRVGVVWAATCGGAQLKNSTIVDVRRGVQPSEARINPFSSPPRACAWSHVSVRVSLHNSMGCAAASAQVKKFNHCLFVVLSHYTCRQRG
jgi:hypothetical protein